MEALSPDSGNSTPGASAHKSVSSPRHSKPQRVLACELCQRRKVKCDREFPCSNCVKSKARCVPGTLAPRQRRRRFPERQLLERLHKYEELLHQNNIDFEPIHKDSAAEQASPNQDQTQHMDDEYTPAGDVGGRHEVKSIWHAMTRNFRESAQDSDSSQDELRDTIIKKAWDQSTTEEDHHLFGSRKDHVDLSTFHPEPIFIFKLWQVYLDNVNPLLKVIHAPTLQGRIIEAASNMNQLSPTMEALLFGIYCTALLSLETEDCQTIFGSSKKDLMIKYHFGCEQALSNCQFLRTNDRECLTALYLYLVSIRPVSVPHSLHSMLGVAIRIAQRMSIYNETVLAKMDILEAELSRRLWWSLVLFDGRISELSGSKPSILNPTWDCKIPLHVNDSDLRSEAKNIPTLQGHPTDSVFAVVRSEMADFVRHTSYHLDFTNPVLKGIAKHFQSGHGPDNGELFRLEEMIEDRYLKHCDETNPLHFMTIWTARAYLAKGHLLEHLYRCSNSTTRLTEAQRDATTACAIRALECDTMVTTSVIVKRFLWYSRSYFPFPAYIHILQDIRQRPTSKHAQQAWEVMSENYKGWFGLPVKDISTFFHIFAKLVLRAWEVFEKALIQVGQVPVTPGVVTSILEKQARSEGDTLNINTDLTDVDISMLLDNFSADAGLATGNSFLSQPYNMLMQSGLTQPELNPSVGGQPQFQPYMNRWHLAALGRHPGWQGF